MLSWFLFYFIEVDEKQPEHWWFFSAKDVQALQYKSYLNFTPSLATYKHTINLVANFWF